jgi:hypothetical protein
MQPARQSLKMAPVEADVTSFAQRDLEDMGVTGRTVGEQVE